ncbi:hypothetical protein [Candidatus Magnetobacterium casense]|uniref:Virion structural protein n=1 Tax=Candidatus Magnetobacterium casense TaxID=1455061 RepID=A0ABS6S4B7_9BACT|nr:hypothetical protein [Candidatus Magnetobacterium casensis]MBV6343697.1 hypothetical protein [Candidatus Magnetobacterium casensis]
MKKVNVNLVGRLNNKFDTTEMEGSPTIPLYLNEGITLVTSADELLKTPKIRRDILTVSSTGWKNVFQVPSGKRYHILATHGDRRSGTTATITNFAVRDSSGVLGTDLVNLFEQTAGADLISGMLNVPITLDSLMYLDYCFAAAGGDTVNVYTLYLEEEAY